MVKPNSFCTITTSNCSFELVGLLLSLSVFHPNEKIYILTDTKTKDYIDTITPQPRLQMIWFIELDKYDGMNRQIMTEKCIFGQFLKNKMQVIKYALTQSSDTMLLDTDIIITDTINSIDDTKEVGLSPQFINQEHIDNTGFYNAGLLWCNTVSVCDTWEACIDNSNHCPEQINMVALRKHSYFEFGENYNLQSWRLILSEETPQQIADHITSKPNDKLYYKNNPLKFVHTHFLDERFQQFNQLIIRHLNVAKMYKQLAIIYRVINNNWVLKIPKQPLKGWGQHANDSYRELPLLMKLQNKDVDLTYDANTIHCWLAPNILTYDRPTLNWCNQELVNVSLFLLGNGDVKEEGVVLKRGFPTINIKPWIFWPRKPVILEQILKENGVLTFDQRNIESIFIGNFENSVQEKYRQTSVSWASVLSEYHCTKGGSNCYKFTHSEYLLKLRESKYGLCLRGYGSKCHREVELMAFGTVPIVTPEVSIESFMNPLIENVHYIRVSTSEELTEKVGKIDKEKWMEMSAACYEWYQTNVHSKNCWNTMINYILYD